MKSRRLVTSQSIPQLQNIDFLPDWLKRRRDFQEEYLKCPSFESIDKASICEKPLKHRNRFEKEALLLWMRSIPSLDWISSFRLRQIGEKLQTVYFKEGETLMHRGDPPDFILLLVEGVAGVYNEEGISFIELKPPNCLGEVSLKRKTERTATIIAHSAVKALRLPSHDFDTLLYRDQADECRENTKFLQTAPFFSSWANIKLDRLSSKAIVNSYQAGQSIYSQGNAAVNVYVVKSGVVELQVLVDIESDNKWPTGLNSWEVKQTTTTYKRTVRTCKAGDLFGEKEVIKNCRRSMQAVCREPTVLFIIENDKLYDVFQDRDLHKLIELNDEEPEITYLKNLVTEDHKKKLRTRKSILDAFGVNPLPHGRPTAQELKTTKISSIASTAIKRYKRQLKAQTVRSTHRLICISKAQAL
jgi:CRP-like cAMP-binding protein